MMKEKRVGEWKGREKKELVRYIQSSINGSIGNQKASRLPPAGGRVLGCARLSAAVVC